MRNSDSEFQSSLRDDVAGLPYRALKGPAKFIWSLRDLSTIQCSASGIPPPFAHCPNKIVNALVFRPEVCSQRIKIANQPHTQLRRELFQLPPRNRRSGGVVVYSG